MAKMDSRTSDAQKNSTHFSQTLMQLIPGAALRWSIYAFSMVLFLGALCVLVGLFKTLVYPGGIFRAGEYTIGYDYGSGNEKNVFAEGVTDIGETRIQWGTFKTTDEWTRVEFRAPFKDENVSVAASTSDEPTYAYAMQTRNVGRSGFEVSYQSLEWDPTFSNLRERDGSPPLTEQDMKSIGASRFDDNKKKGKGTLVGWAFNVVGLKCNYIAVGRKP